MIIGRKKRHKLPKFPEGVESVFEQFCQALPLEAVDDIRKELNKAVSKIIKDAGSNQRIELNLVNLLHKASLALLDRYEGYDEQQRALVIGAIRYFVVEDDPLPDTGFASGFYDDAKVMNYVLDQLDEEDLIIDV